MKTTTFSRPCFPFSKSSVSARHHLSRGLLAAVSAALLGMATASAATFTWDGGNASGNMSLGGAGSNWSGGNAPASSTANDWVFASNTNGQTANNDIANPCLVHNLTHSVPMTFQGFPISFGGSTPTISVAPSSNITYNNDLVIGTNTKFTSTVTTANTSIVTFAGQLSGGTLTYSTTAAAANLTIKFAGSTGNTLSGFTIGDGTSTMASGCPIQIAMDNPFGGAGSTLFMNRADCNFTVLGGPHVVASGLSYRGVPNFAGNYDLTIQGNGAVNSTTARVLSSNMAAGATLTLGTATSTWNLSLTTFGGTGMGVLAAIVSDTGAAGLAKNGTGTWRVTNSNSTYATPTKVTNGTLEFTSIENKGSTNGSSLGKPTVNGTNEIISLGATTTGVTLRYLGSGSTSDRPIDLPGTTGGATLDASGTGPINYTGGITTTGVGSKTLVLTGTGTAANSIGGTIVNTSTAGYTLLQTAFAANAATVTLASVDGIAIGASISGTGIAAGTTVTSINTSTKVVGLSIVASGAGTAGQKMTVTGVTNNVTTAVNKTGNGTWVLSGANSYAGGTTVNNGILLVNNTAGSGTGTGTVTVNSPATLGGTGTMIGSLAVSTGGTVAPGNAGVGTLTNNLTGGKTAAFASGALLAMELGAPGTNDTLAFTGLTTGVSAVTFNGNVINFTNAGGLATGTYTLVTFDADNAYTGTLAIGTGLEAFSPTLIYNSNSIQLQVNAGTAPLPTITISKTTDGAEEGPVNGVFTVTRDTSDTRVTVHYTVTGTATPGSDYTTLSGSVELAPTVTSATITVPVLQDNNFNEGTETVTVTLTPDVAYTVGSPNSDTVNITDGIKPVVSIAGANNGSEVGPTNGSFIVSRPAGGETAIYPLTVYYSVDPSSTATAGSDYTTLSGSVTIPAGQTTATITIAVQQDTDFLEGTELVVLDITPDPSYTIGTGTASISISDGIKPTITIVNTADGAEAGPVNGIFTVTRSTDNGTSRPITVSYSVDPSSTATAGSDYTALSGTVTIAAGATTATIAVPVLQDTNFDEGTETVMVNLSADPTYIVGIPGSATVNIADGIKPVVSITKTTDGAEDGPVNGVFTVSRNPESASSGPVTVLYSTSGTATAGSDYTALSGSVTMALGVSSATITVPVLHDFNFTEGTETVVVTLTPSTTYTVGSPDSATVNIADTTAPALGTVTPFTALYPFTNTIAGTVIDPTPTPYEKAIQFGSFAMVGGTKIGSNGIAGAFYANDWDAAATLNPAAYFQVTITPKAAPGLVAKMTLNTLSFDLARQNSGGFGPVHYAVRSSLDNYTANLATITIDPANPNLTTDGSTVTIGGTDTGVGAWQTGTKLTLDSSFADLSSTAATPTVTFRIYGWGNSADKDGGIDNFQVTGSWVVNQIGGFTAWADANAPGESPSDDHDGDGIPNGVEYFMGQTGSSFTANPAPDNTGKITWPKDPAFSGTYRVETSTDLTTWTDVTSSATDLGTSVQYALPTGSDKTFVRLVVIPN